MAVFVGRDNREICLRLRRNVCPDLDRGVSERLPARINQPPCDFGGLLDNQIRFDSDFVAGVGVDWSHLHELAFRSEGNGRDQNEFEFPVHVRLRTNRSVAFRTAVVLPGRSDLSG